jgi:hypothetical protein
VPTTATLQTGEIAINTADGLVYIRKDDSTIIPLIGVNTAAVTGSVVLLGSITATSFTGSFAGNFSGSVNATLTHSASNGAGIATFVFDGSDDVLVSLDTGSAHFVDGVNNLIVVGTALSASYAVSASHAENADSAQTAVTASYTLIAQQVLGLDTGSFVTTGSISNATITLNQADGTSFSLVVDNVTNAVSASYAATASIAISSSFAENANTSISASYAATASYALAASSSVAASTSVSSSYALSASYAETSTFSTFATNAGKVLVDIVNTSPYRHYLTFVTGSGYNFVNIDPQVLSYVPDTNELDFKGNLIVSGNINLTGVVVGDDTIINDWGSVSASLASIQVGANNLTLQQVTDNGSSTTNSIIAPSFTGSLFGTASYALVAEFALNVASVDSGSFLTTGSVAGDTITLQKIDGSTFDLTVDNVANATSASYAGFASSAESASYAAFTAFAQDAISASYAATASSADDFTIRNNATIAGNLTVEGIVTAQEFHTEFVSASIVYSSGSTKFGDTLDDIHQFTGSVDITGSLTAPDITINEWGSVSASLALISSSAANITLQQVTDNGNVTTLPITASNLNINGFPDVSASLANLEATNTLQGVTDNGNTTTNQIIINNELIVSQSVFSRGEEVLDFAVAMAIALG